MSPRAKVVGHWGEEKHRGMFAEEPVHVETPVSVRILLEEVMGKIRSNKNLILIRQR